MDLYKKERKIHRRLFTTCANQMETMIKEGHAKEISLKSEFRKLKEISSQLALLDQNIKECLLKVENLKDEDLEKELCTVLEYRERWIKIETTLDVIFKEPNKEKEQEFRRNYKLPDIKFKKFDGNIRSWLTYWGQFKKIDADPKIDQDDKYMYLLQSMEEGTEVHSLVESYPPSGASYSLCVEELKTRYAREELLIEIYVRDILELVLQEKRDLIDLYDKLNAHLRALNTLGVSKCAAFILPLVESALPHDILRLWERSKSSNIHSSGPEQVLDALMTFLKAEVESVQRISMAKSTFKERKDTEPTASCLYSSPSTSKNQTVTTTTIKTCIWCGKDTHSSVECYRLSKMTLDERKAHLKKENACTICLKKGHYFKSCRTFIKCYICGKRHSVTICPGKTVTEGNKEEKPEKSQEKLPAKEVQNMHSSPYSESETVLQTVAVRIKNGGKYVNTRALFDNGSQRTYIKQDLAQKLCLKNVGKEHLKQCLFGGVVTDVKIHNRYKFTVESISGNFELDVDALGQNIICGYTNRINLTTDMRNILQQRNIELCDTNDEIGLLIGADFAGFFATGDIVNLNNGMVAINTKLGWTVQGKQSGNGSNVTSLFCMSDSNIADFWSLETLGIRDPVEHKTKMQIEEETIEAFDKTVHREKDGRYEVKLPFKVGHEDLLPNFSKVKQRLDSTTRKLIANGKFQQYNKVFDDWLSLKIIEPVPHLDEERNRGHFLPHKAVIKESSLTSPLRPVFDASAPDKNGLSLNNCLEKGVNFIDKIPNLLIGFRKGEIGITADIAKAFLQISLPPEDRNYLKFLWWEDDSLKQLKVYRHCRVVFGLTCSPFLLAATLKHHLGNVTGEYEETAQLLRKSYYVDNCLTSMDSEEQTKKFILQAKSVMKEAQFDLRMWVTSPLQINETGQEIVHVLGLNWDTVTDELSCNIQDLPQLSALNKITKRVLLSLTQRVFDPIGLTCAVTLPPKLLLQETWRRGFAWDTALPNDLVNDFENWYVNLSYLKHCKIPRRLTADYMKDCNLSLHMFCDASKVAMGSCVFLRAENQNKVTLRLVTARSRVAPPKNISTPRLELMAAVIGVRLLVEARESLQIPGCLEYCWTDSSVTMYWICKDLSWSTFVGNRVKEIKEHTKVQSWRHISGKLNWADLTSRGCNAKQLLDFQWLAGPPFLLSSPEEWPTSSVVVEEKEAEREVRKTTCKVNVCIDGFITDRLLHFSKYTKIVRMVAWMLRFMNNSRVKDNRIISKEITGEEYEEAEKKIMKLIQQDYKDHIEECTKNLNTMTDKDNILRMKTKLLLSNLPEDTKCPIIVTAKSTIIQRLVRQRHIQIQHAGTNMLINDIRKRFWVFGIRRLAKSTISKCMVCTKQKAKHMQAPVAPLPVDRIESSTPFEVTGVDLAGPLVLKSGEKCWIVLYTCAVYRAVHLELTTSLSTVYFMRTFRRFTARRGRVKVVYSDNGTNFTGTKNLLDSLNWDEIQTETGIERIKWKLNAPTAAWWGGFWERLIRSIKDLLRRVLGKARVTYDELHTLLCECESIMNNRPLTYVQDDKADALEPLTPACFLQPLPSSETEDFDELDARSLNIRVKYLQKLRDDFRQRFKAEYLTELIQRGKDKGFYQNLQEGDVVLIESEGRRIKWPMGIITKVFIGKDGVKRTAEVKTSSGIKIRPVQRLYLLEISAEDRNKFTSPVPFDKVDSVQPRARASEGDVRERTTRCGRKVRTPRAFEY